MDLPSSLQEEGVWLALDLPIKRIKEAVSEIRQATRRDKVVGAEGAVIFLERVSSAIEQVDSSSGAIGNAVNRAIVTLVPIIAAAPASEKLRDKWLDRSCPSCRRRAHDQGLLSLSQMLQKLVLPEFNGETLSLPSLCQLRM